MIILHLVQNSLPYISGSTIRSKYIFKYQKRFSKIIVLTSFLSEKNNKHFEIIEGIPYYRINKNISSLLKFYFNIFERLKDILFMFFNIDFDENIQFLIISPIVEYYIKKLIKFYNIDAVHVHSYYAEAQCAQKIANKREIPFIYEHRGFIEENVMANPKIKDKDYFKLLYNKANKFKKKETEIMKKSDLIITLSNIMKKELIKRNLDANKIKIIPNCADTKSIQPQPANLELKQKLKLSGLKIIGFIGRINGYEGIEILIRSIPYLLEQFRDLKVLLIGGGDPKYIRNLKKLSLDLNVSNYILFIGIVPHYEIKEYYSIIDIIVIPRLNLNVNRKVTPLKPLEAMAFRKLVIASNLPALRYVIIPKKTGDLFKAEDPIDLSSKIIYYLKNPEKKKVIEEFSRLYVEKYFSWETIVPKYKQLYLSLLEEKNLKNNNQ